MLFDSLVLWLERKGRILKNNNGCEVLWDAPFTFGAYLRVFFFFGFWFILCINGQIGPLSVGFHLYHSVG